MVDDQGGAPKQEGADDASPHRASLRGFDNRLCMRDCRRALASLAWVWNKESRESHFVFGTIELIPDELPLLDCPPATPCVSLGKKSSWRLYFADHEVPSSVAVEWYEGLALRGEWAASWLNPQIKKPTLVDARMLEPRWPHTVVLGSTKSVPFASQREAATRTHHTLVESSKLNDLLDAKEMKPLVAALKQMRLLDLERYPHLGQSAHLFAPLPILRHYGTRLDSDESGDRAVLVNLVPRLGQRLDTLTIEILEKRPTGRRLLAHARVSTPLARIGLADDVEQIAIRIIDDELGLLVDDGPYAFLQSVAINGQMITSHRRVSVPERGGRPAEVHKIPVAGMEQMMLIGSERGKSAAGLMHSAAARRQRASAGKQHWFRDDPELAQRRVRKILAGARSTVVVLDPYFRAADIRPYLPWVTGRDVQIQVLTSSKGLRDIPHSLALGGDGTTKWAQRELQHLLDLRSEIEACVSQRLINQAAVRVMTGDHPSHDRFLIVDQKAWTLGSSLNAFGTRGTMLIELNDPEAIVPELLRYAEAGGSKTVDERVADLQSQQAAAAGGNP
jgi:hypothetical protein